MKHYVLVMMAVCMAFSANAQQLAFKKLYSTTGPSNQGTGIVEMNNGDLLVSGIRSVPVGTQYIANIILFRINSIGDTLWMKEIGTPTERELANDMILLPNGNIVIVGSVNIPPAGLADGFAVCTDSTGSIIWQRKIGGTMSDAFTDVIFDGSHLLLSGNTESYGNGGNDGWLLKLNLSGDTVWTKTYGGTQTDNVWSVTHAQNSYYLAGSTHSFSNGQFDDVWLIKTDTSGNELWHKEYGLPNKSDWVWNIETTFSNGTADGLVLTGIRGTEPSQPNNIYGDLFFIKTDTAGNMLWDKSISGGTGGQSWRREGVNIKQTSNGGFLISGFKLDLNIPSQQLYVVQTDPTGNVIWDTAIGTSDSSYTANNMTLTKDNGWAITGSVFTPGQQIRYIYVAKFSPVNAGVNTLASGVDVHVFPNPAGEEVTVRVPGNVRLEKVLLYSVDGKHCGTYDHINAGEVSLNIAQTGIFILEIHTDKGVTNRKLLVQ